MQDTRRPDFFILDLEGRRSWHTEIKYRHYLNPLLCDDLRKTHLEWAPFTMILAVGEPPAEWTGTVRHIKVFTVQPDTMLDEGFFKTKGARLQDVFPRLGKRWEEATIQKAQDAILRITSRDEAPTIWSRRGLAPLPSRHLREPGPRVDQPHLLDSSGS